MCTELCVACLAQALRAPPSCPARPGPGNYLQAPIAIVILVLIPLFPLGFLLLLLLQFLLLLLGRGVIATFALRLLFQILLIFRQFIVAPLEDKGER